MSKAKLSGADWELVKDAPHWVNAALEAAEGKQAVVTRMRETSALEKAIAEYKTSNALVRDIIAHQSAPADDVENATQSAAESALGRIANLVESKLGSGELEALNDFLLTVGRSVATSAGEGVLGLGKKMSDKEAAALEGITQALKATPAHKRERMGQAKVEAAEKPREELKRGREEAREERQREREQARQAQKQERQEARQERQREREQAREEMERQKQQAKQPAAEPAQAPAASAGASITEHTVVPGDNLSMISQQYYGTQANWRLIYEANRQVIGEDPNLIRPGQVLRIPTL
ncbi:MAG: LysM peptidoglycan-binding domain-containing protein [Candidatus Promineifilaceae bacterium]